MKSKAAILVALVLSLGLATAALAKTTTTVYTEKGKFQSDGSVIAPISLKVTTVKRGKAAAKPTKITKIDVKTLNYRCPDDDTSGKLDFKLPGPFALKYSKQNKTYDASKDVTVNGVKYHVFLQAAKNGKSAKGSIEFSFKNAAGHECLNAVLGFGVRK